MGRCKNQPNNGFRGGGGFGEGIQTGGTCGGRPLLFVLGGRIERRKKLKERERRGHQFGWLPLDGEMRQPAKIQLQRLAIVRGDSAQGANHGGESCCSFSASDVSGAKKELIDIRRDLGSRRSTIKHNNQPYQRRKRQDRDRRGSATAGECRGGDIRSFWGRSSLEGRENIIK